MVKHGYTALRNENGCHTTGHSEHISTKTSEPQHHHILELSHLKHLHITQRRSSWAGSEENLYTSHIAHIWPHSLTEEVRGPEGGRITEHHTSRVGGEEKISHITHHLNFATSLSEEVCRPEARRTENYYYTSHISHHISPHHSHFTSHFSTSVTWVRSGQACTPKAGPF